jgi:hypothetical protein
VATSAIVPGQTARGVVVFGREGRKTFNILLLASVLEFRLTHFYISFSLSFPGFSIG